MYRSYPYKTHTDSLPILMRTRARPQAAQQGKCREARARVRVNRRRSPGRSRTYLAHLLRR